MPTEVLIPTYRTRDEISEQVSAIEATADVKVIASCRPGSAAENRNWCLTHATGTACVMLDDDITGFYPGWLEQLLEPLDDDGVMVVSARLMRPDGKVGPTCSRCYDLTPETIDIQPGECCVLPTAAISFLNVGIQFDEHYRGSGFEDGDWCFQYRRRFPKCRFIQSNKCRLIHRNEMKEQREHWKHNKRYFEDKWTPRKRLYT